MSNVSSGLMRCFGVMVAHSFILDGQGFPYLSECCYYNLSGCVDKAITLVSETDLGEQVKSLVQQVFIVYYCIHMLLGIPHLAHIHCFLALFLPLASPCILYKTVVWTPDDAHLNLKHFLLLGGWWLASCGYKFICLVTSEYGM